MWLPGTLLLNLTRMLSVGMTENVVTPFCILPEDFEAVHLEAAGQILKPQVLS